MIHSPGWEIEDLVLVYSEVLFGSLRSEPVTALQETKLVVVTIPINCRFLCPILGWPCLLTRSETTNRIIQIGSILRYLKLVLLTIETLFTWLYARTKFLTFHLVLGEEKSVFYGDKYFMVLGTLILSMKITWSLVREYSHFWLKGVEHSH